MNRLPLAFVLAFVIQAVVTAIRIGLNAVDHLMWLRSASWNLTTQAVGFTTVALIAAGAFELARRTPRSASTAARVAGWAFVIAVGLTIAGVAADYFQMTRAGGAPPIEVLYQIEGYLWVGLLLVGGVALVLAGGGWRTSPVLATVAVIALVIARGPFVPEYLFGALGRTLGSIVLSGAWLGFLATTFVLISRSEQVELAEDGAACEVGLRRAASSLWLRVIAAGLIALITVVAVIGQRGAMSLIQVLMVAGPAINAFALGTFALGAFTAARSGVRDFSQLALYAAGALSLWASGAMLVQLPWVYGLFSRDNLGGYGEFGSEMVSALTLVIPLVATTGVVALMMAIGGFLRRRDLQELAAQTSVRTGAFVGLLLLSLVIQNYGLPKAPSQGAFLLMGLVAAVAGLLAIATAARTCTLAADAVRQAPGLPTATLREPT